MRRVLAVLVAVLVLGAWTCAPQSTSGDDDMAGMTPAGLAALARGETWIAVGDPGAAAFENGWSGIGRYRLRGTDIVDLRVDVFGGTPGSVIFTLPEGYRPNQNVAFSVTGEIGSTPSAGLVLIGTDGTVYGDRDGSSDHQIIYLTTQMFLDSY